MPLAVLPSRRPKSGRSEPNVDAVGEGVASAEADAGGGGPRHDQLQWSRPATGPVDRTGARAGRRVVIR